ncbi:MAG: hypothetical protein LBH39_00165 [Clostridiales Family XIII bacterium]|jgi:hypothetical protein|nr:hypothetical protein [Clostridiales Family XIII bacterium]
MEAGKSYVMRLSYYALEYTSHIGDWKQGDAEYQIEHDATASSQAKDMYSDGGAPEGLWARASHGMPSRRGFMKQGKA